MSLPFNRIFLAALAVSALALAPARGYAQAHGDDDDDEAPPASAPAATPSPTPAKPATPAPAATTPAKPASPAPAAAPAATDVPPSAAAATAAPEIQLTGGAPLNDPNVHVHTVQRKVLADKGRSELVLFPAVAQINGKFTNHLGVAAEYLYHFQENVAFQITPSYFYVNGESSFNEDLVNIARLQAQAATALTMIWNVEAGVEAAPIYGKFAFYDGNMASFSLVLDAGLGVAQTRVQLRPSSVDDQGNETSASFGDTGFRFMGNVGGGFRVRFGEHWVARLEIRDQVYTASVTSVNGCDAQDLDQIQSPVNSSCDPTKFATDANGSQPDVALARALVKTPSSDVLNQVLFFGGVAYVF
jgi:outer membrane beta-barrel protein